MTSTRREKEKYNPPKGIPMFTHLIALGYYPDGRIIRCKNCGASTDSFRCPYCSTHKGFSI